MDNSKGFMKAFLKKNPIATIVNKKGKTRECCIQQRKNFIIKAKNRLRTST